MNITYDMTTKEEDTQKLIVDGAEKDVKRMKYIFTPNHSLTEKHFFLGNHHTDWEFEECKNIWIKRFYDEWLVEAGYDTLYYQVDVSSGLISEKNKISNSDHINKWRKPNSFQEVSATTVGEI